MGTLMENPNAITAVASVAGVLEAAAVILIAASFAHALLRALFHFSKKRDDAYSRLRVYLGKALLLGLELLVAADIIRTVLIETTMQSIISLGLLVLVRIVLGWSIAVEVEGCWPWQMADKKVNTEGGSAPHGKE